MGSDASVRAMANDPTMDDGVILCFGIACVFLVVIRAPLYSLGRAFNFLRQHSMVCSGDWASGCYTRLSGASLGSDLTEWRSHLDLGGDRNRGYRAATPLDA